MGFNARADDATLVLATREGDHDAFELLLQRWLARAHETASFVLANAHDAAGATADGFEHAWRRIDELEPPSEFGPDLLRATRRAALGRIDGGAAPLDRLEASRTLVTHNGTTPEERLAQAKSPSAMSDPDLAAVVRSAGVALDPSERSVLVANLRDGVTAEALAADLGLRPDEAEQLIFRVGARFRAALEARVLWRAGHPLCRDLVELLGTKASRFDSQLATVVTDHAEGCTVCQAAKRIQPRPTALLAAVPVADAPDQVESTVRERLVADGFVGTATPAARLARVFGRAEGEGDDRRRRRGLLLAGGAVLAVVAVVLLAIHPWTSPGKPNVGVLGGASDGSNAHGSIDLPGTSLVPSTRADRTTSTVARTPSTAASSTTQPAATTTRPLTIVAPPDSGVKRPVITSASATRVGPCTTGEGQLIHVTWQTTNSTAVTITPTPTQPGPGPFGGSGSADLCSTDDPPMVTINAVGPGGGTSQTLQVGTTTTTSTTPSTTTSTTRPGLVPPGQ
ncbi:MAG TPA: sigma-70 family RNA polymerase sigma factor [Acidimicrobiales bacterium]|nr:sigma-70 family RNA polymerase sigma factor [Acidimicrobiales bacterium]